MDRKRRSLVLTAGPNSIVSGLPATIFSALGLKRADYSLIRGMHTLKVVSLNVSAIFSESAYSWLDLLGSHSRFVSLAIVSIIEHSKPDAEPGQSDKP